MLRQCKDAFKLVFGWVTVRIRRGPLAGMRWIVWSGQRFWQGTYELEKTDAVIHAVSEGQVTFDIGGHVGYFALMQSKLVGAQGHVYTFEPRGVNAVYIRRHIQLNEVRNVTLIEAAVADRAGDRRFESRTGTGSGHLSPQGNLVVPTKAIDELIEEQGYPTPDFIKIDVEGGELEVIEGARRTIMRRQPTLLVATHGEREHQWVLQFLDDHNYTYEILNPAAVKGDIEILARPAA